MKKKLTTGQKLFHFICYPVLCFILIYAFIAFLNYISNDENFSLWEIVIPVSIGITIIYSVIHWVKVLYPPQPKQHSNEPKKPFKEYIFNGTPFHKLMTVIYSLCILAVIVIISLTIGGYL